MSGHGGAREGAGRKPNAEKYDGQFTTLTDGIAGHLAKVEENLKTLADGGEIAFDLEYKAAGTITRKGVARNKDETVIRDDKGKPVIVDVPVYPELPPEQLVLVTRKVKHLAPDFKANELMVDRIGGKARTAPEADPEAMNLEAALDLADGDMDLYEDPDEAEGATDAG